MATYKELALATPSQLKKYLETLPTKFELRFPSITSLDGTDAVIMIIPNYKTHCVLLGAYDTALSGIPKDTLKVEGDGITDTPKQGPAVLLMYGLTKETGLVAEGLKWLGFPKETKSTNPNIDLHFKYYGLVTKFKGTVKAPDPILNPKIKEYVWVKEDLLYMIFDQLREILGVPMKPHPQKEGYVRFQKNKNSKKVTLREMFRFRKKRFYPK